MKEDEKDFLEESFRKEVLKSIDKNLSEKEKKELMEEANVSLKFLDKINEIELPKDNYVIFTDGKEQLIYENGEFFVVSSTSTLKQRKKKTKKEATDMYLDYFIKYQLNPILDSRKEKQKAIEEKAKTKANKTKQIQKIAEDKKIKNDKIIEKEDLTR